jgi:hypothetical protein
MDWKMYALLGLLVLLGVANNWEVLKEGFRELYNKRRGKKNGTSSKSGR